MSKARGHFVRVILAVQLGAVALPAVAQSLDAASQWPTADKPAWPTSPFHGVIDGNGRIIPCRCRFNGREYMLGEQVCLALPDGNVLARCDLAQNNTSWVRTTTTCTVSLAPASSGSIGTLASVGARTP